MSEIENKPTTDLTTTEDQRPPRPMMQIIVDHQDNIADFLPNHIDEEKFFLIANGILRGSTALRNCIKTGKGTAGFLGALKQAALDGLMPDGKIEAAIVPYGGIPTYVRMYHGMVKMMRQSGEIKDINTGLVCENDQFDFCRGTDNYVRHKQAFKDRGAKIAAWCVIRTKDGGEYFDIMGADEIIQIKNAAKAKNGPWGNKAHEGQMWRKTVLRRASKLAPISTDLQNRFAKEDDETYDFSHLQAPTEAERFLKNAKDKKKRPVIDIDPSNQDAAGSDEATEIEKKLSLPDDLDTMGEDDWDRFTADLIAEMKRLAVAQAVFESLYNDELDYMAQLSSGNYDKYLDAIEADPEEQ